MLSLASLFGRHEIDEWRDHFSIVAAAALNQAAADLISYANDQVEQTGLRDGLFGQSSFIVSHIAPTVRSVTEAVVLRIIQTANLSLKEIVGHQAVWHDKPEGPQPGPNAFDGWQDIVVAAGPLAGGAAVAVALPAMAITTTTAWFGLVTMTAVSWPIVAIAGAVAGAAVVTGAVNTVKIRDKTRARLRLKVRDYIASTLIEGTPQQQSVLSRVIECLDTAAEQAKRD